LARCPANFLILRRQAFGGPLRQKEAV